MLPSRLPLALLVVAGTATATLTSPAGAATPASLPTGPSPRPGPALLYEKRYSLFFEGPQRLVDLRAYGLLKAGITTPEGPNDPFNTAFPIPKGEADARGGKDKLTPVCS